MFSQIMEVLKSISDIFKYVYCWCSDTAEMYLLFYAENWWDIESDFNFAGHVSKTSTHEPKKAAAVDKCPFWNSLWNKSESDPLVMYAVASDWVCAWKPWIAGSKMPRNIPDWSQHCGAWGIGFTSGPGFAWCLVYNYLYLSRRQTFCLFGKVTFFSTTVDKKRGSEKKIFRHIA